MYRKVDHLKIFMTPGTPAASPDEFIPCFITPEEAAVVVSEAKSTNIRTTAHCVGGRGLDICIQVGIDVIDHLYSVSPEQIKALENDFGGWVDMTSGIVLDEGREAVRRASEREAVPVHLRHFGKNPLLMIYNVLVLLCPIFLYELFYRQLFHLW